MRIANPSKGIMFLLGGVLAVMTVLGVAPSARSAIAFPASGTWSCDVWFVHWSAPSNSSLTIDPFVLGNVRPAILRYYAGVPVYYYGPWVNNPTVATHHKSTVSGATNGTFIGDYFQRQGDGLHYRLYPNSSCNPG